MGGELKLLRLNNCVIFRKLAISKTTLGGEKRLILDNEHKDWIQEQRKKDSCSDDSRFPLFQVEERIRIGRAVEEVLHPSCLTVQSLWGTVMIWGFFSWSGLDSAMPCAQKMRPADYLSILNDRVIPSMDFFFSPEDKFQDDNVRNHQVQTERMVQGLWSIVFTHEEANLTPLRTFKFLPWEDLTQLHDSSIINARGKIFLSLWLFFRPGSIYSLIKSL